MKLSESIKPISYLKAHASEIVNDIYKNRKTYIITQNGYAKVVLYSIDDYEDNLRKINSLQAELLKKNRDFSLNKKIVKSKKNKGS
jgi:prevent-host-death family protein